MSEQTTSTTDVDLAALLDDLSSPDPAIRDGASLDRLCELIDSGTLSEQQSGWLGSQLTERLSYSTVEARSFAALVLARLVMSGVCEPEWFRKFAHWYALEDDVTGYDTERGWLHAVAHGADALGVFGWTWQDSPRPVLDLAAKRLLNPSPAIWRDQEDDRLGFAIAVVLSNPQLTEDDATAWMEPLKQAFTHRGPGPVPAFVSNTIRTLRVVCFLIGVTMEYEGQGIMIQHPGLVERKLREVLHVATPWMWNLKS